MLGEIIQKSMLEWLQLSPELLSGLGRRAVAPKSPAVAASVPQPVAGSSDIAPITFATVQPSTSPIGFFTPPATRGTGLPEPWQRSMADAYSPDEGPYSPLEAGGSQRAALAEMTGYLTTRLAPAPVQPNSSTASPISLGSSIANAGE